MKLNEISTAGYDPEDDVADLKQRAQHAVNTAIANLPNATIDAIINWIGTRYVDFSPAFHRMVIQILNQKMAQK